MSKDQIRAFIAIELPEGAKLFLKETSDHLRSFGGDVRWAKVASMHLTIKFLGDIAQDTRVAIERGLAPVFGSSSLVTLTVFGAGAFPGSRKPRVIWAGVKDSDGILPAMASRVEKTLEPLGFRRESRPFRPHLTLGRVRSLKRIDDLVTALRQMSDIEGPTFVADHAVLFQSILKPSGAEYRALRRFDFSTD